MIYDFLIDEQSFLERARNIGAYLAARADMESIMIRKLESMYAFSDHFFEFMY